MFKDEGDVQTINGRAWFVYVPGNSCCQISHKHQIGRNDFLLIFADLVPRCKEAFIQKHEKCIITKRDIERKQNVLFSIKLQF